ncbi:hypothetical protein Bca101_028598 [Brassica carinata]
MDDTWVLDLGTSTPSFPFPRTSSNPFLGLRLAPKDRPVNPRRSRRSPPRIIQRCWPATCNWTSGRARVKCPYWARRPSRATSASGGPRTLDLPKKGQRAR